MLVIMGASNLLLWHLSPVSAYIFGGIDIRKPRSRLGFCVWLSENEINRRCLKIKIENIYSSLELNVTYLFDVHPEKLQKTE